MPSIFEKPSLLGFRADGGEIDNKRWEAAKLALLREVQRVAQERGVDINDILQGNIQKTGVSLSEIAQKITSPGAGFGNTRPVFTGSDGSGVDWSKVALSLQNETPQALSRFAPMLQSTQPVAPAATPTPTTPTAQPATPSMFGPPAPGEQIFGPPSIFAGQQPQAPAPAGSRAANIAAAKASGDFETKRTQYNQEAQRLGHPTMMDGEGNIVPRELSEPEKMREFFKTTGGNTMFTQTNDPAQRALQNEMMKQARAQATVNTFGSTPEERLANLQAETEARQILRSPLNSGVREVAPGVRAATKERLANLQAETDARKILQSPLNSGVREVAPGVRAATKDGKLVGVFAPGDGSPATMNDPLKRYITNPDGSVSPNPNPPQILMSDEMKDIAVRQGIEGKTGGSPLEMRLVAAMQAEEAKKKKAAASAPAQVAAPSAPAQSQIPPEFRVRPGADAAFDEEVAALEQRRANAVQGATSAPPAAAAPAQSQIPPEFRVRPGADAAFDEEVAALEQRRANAVAPGFNLTEPSDRFAEVFGYGNPPAIPPSAFGAFDPRSRPVSAIPPSAFGAFDPRSRPVSAFPMAAAPTVTVPDKAPPATPILAAAPSTTGSLVGSIFTDPKTKQRKIW